MASILVASVAYITNKVRKKFSNIETQPITHHSWLILWDRMYLLFYVSRIPACLVPIYPRTRRNAIQVNFANITNTLMNFQRIWAFTQYSRPSDGFQLRTFSREHERASIREALAVTSFAVGDFSLQTLRVMAVGPHFPHLLDDAKAPLLC